MKEFAASALFLLGVFATISAIVFLGLGLRSLVVPANARIDYATFSNGQSFNEGMIRDLQNMRLEYAGATDEKKAVIRAVALQRFSTYDRSKLPLDLQTFYTTLENQK